MSSLVNFVKCGIIWFHNSMNNFESIPFFTSELLIVFSILKLFAATVRCTGM